MKVRCMNKAKHPGSLGDNLGFTKPFHRTFRRYRDPRRTSFF